MKIINNIIWCLKQILPLIYFSEYEVELTPTKKVRQICVWKMWLGHSYNINTWIVEKKVEYMTDKEII